MSSVGYHVGDRRGDCGGFGIGGCVYRFPLHSIYIKEQSNPIDDIVSFAGEKVVASCSDGALGRDTTIVMVKRSLKMIPATNNSRCFVVSSVRFQSVSDGWGDPIFEMDECIVF